MRYFMKCENRRFCKYRIFESRAERSVWRLMESIRRPRACMGLTFTGKGTFTGAIGCGNFEREVKNGIWDGPWKRWQ
jgi:hypothetical protein